MAEHCVFWLFCVACFSFRIPGSTAAFSFEPISFPLLVFEARSRIPSSRLAYGCLCMDVEMIELML